MPKTLPKPIAAYISESNAHNAHDAALPFTEDAVVRDEGRDNKGIAAIRAWKAETVKKYRPIVEVLGVEEAGGRTIVRAKVSGNFAGSPVELSYAFTPATRSRTSRS